MKICIMVLLCLGFGGIFTKLHFLEQLNTSLEKTKTGLDVASRERALEERKKLLQIRETYSGWYRIELLLCYSGIKYRFEGMTVEWFVLLNLVVPVGAVCVGFVLRLGYKALLLAPAIWLLEGGILRYLKRKNYRKTEQNLTKFLDFLGNYSVTSGEITAIFEQIGRYMEEPISGALNRCVLEASMTGDTQTALYSMAESIEHPRFKELVRNMEISIRYCADFSSLVAGSRRSLREYMHTVRERKSIMREGIINLVMLLSMSVVVLLAVGQLTGTDMKVLLLDTWPGRIGLGILAGVVLFFKNRMNRLG